MVINQTLSSNNQYIGYTEILPKHFLHQKIFYGLIPRYRIVYDKIDVLYSDENDEFLADDIIEFINSNYSYLEDLVFRNNFEKKCIGNKFIIFDSQNSFQIELLKQSSLLTIQEEHNLLVHRVLEELSDHSPDTLDELFAAIRVLEDDNLDETHCSQIGVSLRRCIENLTKEVFPNVDTKKPAWVQKKWNEFSSETDSAVEKIRNKILFDEIKEILNMSDKVIDLFKLSNKSVHESITINYYKKVLLRIFFVIDDILDIFVFKRTVKADYSDFFYESIE